MPTTVRGRLVHLVLGTLLVSSCTFLEDAPTTTAAPPTTVAPATTPAPVTAPTPSTTEPPLTTTLPPSPADVTASTTTAPALIEMGSNGLGPATFGDPAEEVMAALVGRWGLPDVDESLRSPIDPYHWGLVGDDYLRRASWTDRRLHVIFSDSPLYYRTDGVPHLIGYSCGSPACAAPEGLSVGDRVEDLQNLFGPLLLPTEPDECGDYWHVDIEADPTPDDWWTGARDVVFDGDPSEPGTRISSIGSGARSGC